MQHDRIFVHVVAEDGPRCSATVRDLFARARHPQRVSVGIAWMAPAGDGGDSPAVETRPQQVRVVRVPPDVGQAPGSGRRLAQRLWNGEAYCLQLDGPMHFAQDWDVVLLDLLAQCDAAEPVLTLCPPACTPDSPEGPEAPAVLEGPATLPRATGFGPDGLVEFTATPWPPEAARDRPLPTAACAGACLFGPSRWLRDVPADPDIAGPGEALNLALRLWTAGFDLFAPPRHLLARRGAPATGRQAAESAVHDARQRQRHLDRLRALCGPTGAGHPATAQPDASGLGTRRSLQAYEAFSGIDLGRRTIAPWARAYPFIHPPEADRAAPAQLDDLVPAPGIHVFLLGDEALLFREAGGEFHRLNGAAAFIWCARDEGYSWARIAREQAAARQLPLAEAARDVTAQAVRWRAQGLLRPAGPGDAPPRMQAAARPDRRPSDDEADHTGTPATDGLGTAFSTHDYDLLGVTMRVCYGSPGLEQRIHPVLAHLRAGGRRDPCHTFTVAEAGGRHLLGCDGRLLRSVGGPAALAPPLKWQMLRHAVERQDVIVQIHAGAVELHGCLVLLPGHSGNGKTMLTARLVAAGGRYFSDEVVLFERGRMAVRPMPISLCVKEKGLPLLGPLFAGLAELPVHDREDGLAVRYLPPPARSLPPGGHSAEPRLLVFRRYVPEAPQTLRRLPPAEAFGRLMDYCVAIPTPLSVQDAAELIARLNLMACYDLCGSDLDQDAQAVAGLCRQIDDPDDGNVPDARAGDRAG